MKLGHHYISDGAFNVFGDHPETMMPHQYYEILQPKVPFFVVEIGDNNSTTTTTPTSLAFNCYKVLAPGDILGWIRLRKCIDKELDKRGCSEYFDNIDTTSRPGEDTLGDKWIEEIRTDRDSSDHEKDEDEDEEYK